MPCIQLLRENRIPSVKPSIESLSNYNGYGNENVKEKKEANGSKLALYTPVHFFAVLCKNVR